MLYSNELHIINKETLIMAIINGTAGNDIKYGTHAADTINGLAGDDTLYGGLGNDSILGGLGNDKLLGEGGDDYLNGSGASVNGRGTGEYDELVGGLGADTFSLATDLFRLATGQKIGNAAYLDDDVLKITGSKGFALIHDFNISQGDKVELDGYAAHYDLVPVFWSQSFGSSSVADTAIVYTGPEQDKFEVVGVLKDVSLSRAYLQTSSFTYLG
jgi:Ca2+-binding RTX toxin-like protein